MSLFRRKKDGTSLKFHCVCMNDTDLRDITKLIEANGGIMGEKRQCPIKFVPRATYKYDMYPKYTMYDTDFIIECIRTQTIVNPSPYKLGENMSGESCLMNKFLFGQCAYERFIETVQEKSISGVTLKSSNEDEEDTNETRMRANVTPTRSEEFFSALDSQNQNLKVEQVSNTEEYPILQCQMSSHDVNSSIEQSQSTFARIHVQELQTTFASGDDSPSRNVPSNVSNQKRPCNVEYEAGIKSNILELSDRLKFPHQKRSPRTMTKVPLPFASTQSLTIESDCPVKIEIPDDDETQWFGESVRSSENLVKTSNLLRSNTQAISPGTISNNSSLSTVLKSSNESMEFVEIPYAKNLATTPERISRHRETPRSRGSDPLSERTAEPEARTSDSPRNGTKTKCSSSWIESDDDSMQEQEATERSDAVARYTRSRDNSKSLLRLNPVASSSDHSSKIPNLRYQKKKQKSHGRVKNVSLIEKMPVGIEITMEKKTSVHRPSKHPANDADWNLPGTSGVSKRSRMVNATFIDSDTSEDNPRIDDRMDDTRNYKKKKSCFDEDKAKGQGNGKSIDIILEINSESEMHEIPVKLTPFKVSRNNGRSHKNEGKRKNRRRYFSVSGSDSSDGDDESRKTQKSKSKRDLAKSLVKAEKNYNYSTNSEKDEKEEGEIKRITCSNNDRQRQNGIKNRRFLSSLEKKDDTDAVSKKKKIIRSGWIETRNNADANAFRVWSDDSGNENSVTSRNRVKNEEKRKKIDALKYGQNWRLQLKSDIPKDQPRLYRPFTNSDRQMMVTFLLSFENTRYIFPKGLKIWKEMIKRGMLTDRTPQSLQNHFVKYLLPTIQNYFSIMKPEHKKFFKDLQTSSRTLEKQ